MWFLIVFGQKYELISYGARSEYVIAERGTSSVEPLIQSLYKRVLSGEKIAPLSDFSADLYLDSVKIFLGALLKVRGEGNKAELSDFLESIAGQPNFVYNAADNAEYCTEICNRFVCLDGMRSGRVSENGLEFCVDAGERSQLRFDFSKRLQSGFVHFLFKSNFDVSAELYAAARWLHEDDDEEVFVRFRQSSIVIGKSIEIPIRHNLFNLLSLGRVAGCDVVMFNGLPVYWRMASSPAPSGFVLDLIGSATEHSIFIPLFLYDEKLPLFLCQEKIAGFLNFLLDSYVDSKDLESVVRVLYSFSGAPWLLWHHVHDAALNLNFSHPLGYRDFVSNALNDLSCKKSATCIKKFEPLPMLDVQGVSMLMDANPSLHASLRYLIKERPKQRVLLDNINFKAYEGDIIGVLGKNGAGKSTLLKAMVGAMPISSGRIEFSDRPLLMRPGAGVQGDLSGRENIIKIGIYMGMLPSETKKIIDEVIEFAELEEHIDRPFKYYSDGMRARLIFSLATAVPRDILLFDELLSAGDMGFQAKAMKRLGDFMKSAKLVFVVQHTFDFILTKCTKCLLVEDGRQVYFGDPKIATELYKESL